MYFSDVKKMFIALMFLSIFLSYLQAHQIGNTSNTISFGEEKQIMENAKDILDHDLDQIQGITLGSFRETKYYDDSDVFKKFLDFYRQENPLGGGYLIDSSFRENTSQNVNNEASSEGNIHQGGLQPGIIGELDNSYKYITPNKVAAQTFSTPFNNHQSTLKRSLPITEHSLERAPPIPSPIPVEGTILVPESSERMEDKNNQKAIDDKPTKTSSDQQPTEMPKTSARNDEERSPSIKNTSKITENKSRPIDHTKSTESPNQKSNLKKSPVKSSKSKGKKISRNRSQKENTFNEDKKARRTKRSKKDPNVEIGLDLVLSDSDSLLSPVDGNDLSLKTASPIAERSPDKSKKKKNNQPKKTKGKSRKISKPESEMLESSGPHNEFSNPNSIHDTDEISSLDKINLDLEFVDTDQRQSQNSKTPKKVNLKRSSLGKNRPVRKIKKYSHDPISDSNIQESNSDGAYR